MDPMLYILSQWKYDNDDGIPKLSSSLWEIFI